MRILNHDSGYNATHLSILTSMDAGLFHGSGPAPIGTRHWSSGGDPRLRPRIHGSGPLSMEVARCWCPLLFLPFPCHKVNCPKISILATWTQEDLKDQAEEEGSTKKRRRRDTECKLYKKA